MTCETARLEQPTMSFRGYSPSFVAALENGDAWAREACVVVLLAWRKGIALSEDALVLADVRDLQSLAACLRAGGRGQGTLLAR